VRRVYGGVRAKCLRLGCGHLRGGRKVLHSLQRNVLDATCPSPAARRCKVLVSGKGVMRVAALQRRWTACGLMLPGSPAALCALHCVLGARGACWADLCSLQRLVATRRWLRRALLLAARAGRLTPPSLSSVPGHSHCAKRAQPALLNMSTACGPAAQHS